MSSFCGEKKLHKCGYIAVKEVTQFAFSGLIYSEKEYVQRSNCLVSTLTIVHMTNTWKF